MSIKNRVEKLEEQEEEQQVREDSFDSPQAIAEAERTFSLLYNHGEPVHLEPGWHKYWMEHFDEIAKKVYGDAYTPKPS